MRTAALVLATLLAAAGSGASGDDPPRPPGEETAVRYLLSQQRPDGLWGTDQQHLRDSIGPRLAVTAIVVMALHDHPAEGPQAEAVRRGRRLLIDRLNGDLGADSRAHLWNWAAVFGLHAMVREFERRPAEEVRGAVENCIAALERTQNREGGWHYGVVAQRRNVKKDEEYKPRMREAAISFMTASTLIALFDARRAGFEVPQKMIDRALGLLKKCRRDDGTYLYHCMNRRGGLAGSSVRTMVVELALMSTEDGSAERLRRAVGNFFLHRDHLQNPLPLGTQDWRFVTHVGLEHIAPYYWFYGVLYAAQALNFLDESARIPVDRHDVRDVRSPAECRALLVSIVKGLQKPDGSWFGSTAAGSHFATGAALLALSGRNVIGYRLRPTGRDEPDPVPDFGWSPDLLRRFRAGEDLSEEEELALVVRFRDHPEDPALAAELGRRLKGRAAKMELIGAAREDPRLLSAILPFLEGEDGYVLLDALATIRMHDAKEHADRVADLLSRKKGKGKWAARETLVALGAAEHADAIAAFVSDAWGYTPRRIRAAHALGSLGAKEHADAIMGIRSDFDLQGEYYGDLCLIMARLGVKDHMDRFRRFLVFEDVHFYPDFYWEQAAMVFEGLVVLNDRESADAIAPFLGYPFPDVRGRAVWALGRLGTKGHTAAVAEMLTDREICAIPDLEAGTWHRTTIGETAARALADLGAREFAFRVEPFLRDGRSCVRGTGVQVLGRLEAREASGKIRKLVGDRGWCVRYDGERRVWAASTVGEEAARVLKRWAREY
ncbi:MAG: hypothetical protein ACYTAF_11820 [Planctomycetota bacterium]|jgi:HEAT repeat protein